MRGAVDGAAWRAMAVVIVVAAPAGVEAQTVLLPSRGAAVVLERYDDAILAAARTAVEAEGDTLVTAAQVEASFGVTLEDGCDACVRRGLAAAGAHRAMAIALWGDRAPPGSVAVVLMDAEGVQVDAEATVEGGDVERALRAAIATALGRWPSRGGVPVRIVGSPPGATVTVDGQPFGTLPVEGRLLPGAHVVVIAAPGFEIERREVAVEGGGAAPLVVRAELAPRDAPPAAASRRGWIAGPILLGGGAAAVLAEPIHALAARGCTETAAGFCTEEARIDRAPFAAAITVGSLAAAGALVWGVVGALRRKDAEASRVDIGLDRVTVRF